MARARTFRYSVCAGANAFAASRPSPVRPFLSYSAYSPSIGGVGGEQTLDLRRELRRGIGGADPKLLVGGDRRQPRGDDRQARGEILVELERVDALRQLARPEGDDPA